jgi:hypothetical protein
MSAKTSQPRRDRPDIPKEYGIAQGDEGMVEWSWVVDQLKQSRIYWLISQHPEGRPHCVPSWGAWVEGKLYFSGGDMTRHAKNLAHNPDMIAHLESGDRAVIIYGRAEKAVNVPADIMAQVEADYVKKYGAAEGATYALVPHKVLAWTATDSSYATSPTRFMFE